MGYRAVELLLQQIEGETGPVETVKLATRLVRRESCGCGRGARFIAEGETAAMASGLADPPTRQTQLAQAMAAAVLAETQGGSLAQVRDLCGRLLATFIAGVEQNDRAALEHTLDVILRQASNDRDDPHPWQAAISLLSDELPQLLPTWSAPETRARAFELVDEARVTISAGMWRQHRRYVVAERWTVDRIGLLTAHLLTALDETQVYQVLAQHLPEMGIHAAWVAEFMADGDDPVAGSLLRAVTPPGLAVQRFPSRGFPPSGMGPADESFSLTLLPLVSPRGQLGYAVFDTTQLDLYGAIVQQLAAALNTAQLYREATEGRRLAEEANLMKSRFLSTVSHELRTPLNLIVGLSGILLQESDENSAPLPEPIRKDVERIQRQRPASGLAHRRRVGPRQQRCRTIAPDPRIRGPGPGAGYGGGDRPPVGPGQGSVLARDLPSSGPWVWGDRTRLRQVALNLVSNAVKFTARGEVTPQLEVNADVVTCRVSATPGLGIPPAEQQRHF